VAFAVALLAGAAVAFLGVRALQDEGTAWLPGTGPARWIVFPVPADMRAQPLAERVTVFRRTVDLPGGPPATATISVRAFRRAELFVNGKRVPLSEPATGGWQAERHADVGPLLRAGPNEMVVSVRNDAGPPALWLALSGPGLEVGTDASWNASIMGSVWRPAVAASDPASTTRIDPDGLLPSPWAGSRARWLALLAMALVAAAAALLTRSACDGPSTAEPARRSDRCLLAAIAAAAVAWIALYAHDAPRLPLQLGFDAGGHLEYVAYLLQRHAIPLANEGWQMFQPPLYYLLAALGLSAAGAGIPSPAAAWVFRGLGLAAGLANVVLAGLLIRRMAPASASARIAGILLAAFLPPALYLGLFPTNEPLAAVLSTAALVLAVRLLDSNDRIPARSLGLGAVLGLALLAKFSTLLVLVVILGALVARAAAAPEGLRGRRWGSLAWTGAALLAVSGWHFGRVWIRLGSPFVGGWEARPGMGWWLEPGYRTARHFLRFGRALTEPAFAGVNGFWDGIYSTLWGDGMLSGLSGTAPLPPWWSPDLWAAGYLLALVPASLAAVGFVASAIAFLRRPSAADGLVVGLPLLVLVAMVAMSVRVPSVAQDKAFYGLQALGPLAVLAARGLGVLAGARRWREIALLAALGTWSATSYATFWIDDASARIHVLHGIERLGTGDAVGGIAALREAVRVEPGDGTARVALARALVDEGLVEAGVEDLLRPSSPLPALASRHLAIALWEERRGRPEAARAAVLRSLALDPDQVLAWTVRANLAEDRGDVAGAAEAWREVLRLEPGSREAHRALARLLARTGDDAGSRFHAALAGRAGG
jgi:hypothetical protein